MEYKCPQCGSLIYSRRNVFCGVCGERLPDALLFTPEERAVVERALADARRRARQARAGWGSGGDASVVGGDFGGDGGGGGGSGGGD